MGCDPNHPGVNHYYIHTVEASPHPEFRLVAFNAFNHTQFFGPAAVDGGITTALFGHVVNATPPRLMQAALKFRF